MTTRSEEFSEEEASAIITRAIEIDARAGKTSITDLRAIASEIGVSPESLELALREQVSLREVEGRASERRVTTLVTALGIPMGAAVAVLLDAQQFLPLLGLNAVGIVASGALVAYQGATGSLRRFHLKNLVLWSGVAAGGIATSMVLGDGIGVMPALGIFSWTIKSWFASSILGTAAIAAVRRARGRNFSGGGERTDDRVGPGGPASLANEASPRKRGATRLFDLLSRPWRHVTSLVRQPVTAR